MSLVLQYKSLPTFTFRRVWMAVIALLACLGPLDSPLPAGEPQGIAENSGTQWRPTRQQPALIRESNAVPSSIYPLAEYDSNRIKRLEQQVEALQFRLTTAEELAVHTNYIVNEAIQPEPECVDCLPTNSDSHFGFAYQTEYPTLKWTGFLQLDNGWIYQDDSNTETVGDIDPSTGLRRVRLRVAGNIRHDSSYIVDLDFAASGHPSFRDVVLRLHKIPIIQNLQFGYFQQPFGMDALTSGRELLFMERSLPFAFAPFRQTGISAYGTFSEKRGTWSTSTYLFPTDAFGVFNEGSGGHAFASRVTYLPLDRGDARLLHLGLDYSMGDPGDNNIRYAIEPGFFVTDPSTNARSRTVPAIVDTGNIPTHFYNLFNAELAGSYGPFHVQSEARFSAVNQVGGPLLTFPGYYVMAGYNLTGETRPYDRENGVFSKTVPHRDFELGRGGGAYELVAGWAYIDLNSYNIEGGRASTLSGGMNWYLNRHVKFSLNIISISLDDATVGRSHAWVATSRVQAEF